MGLICCKEEIDFNVPVELAHFQLMRSVGKGAFGKVRIVQHKKDKKIYALKYINKEKCVSMKAVENIIQERRLLEDLEHDLICNLRFAFQDDENMFMVIDLMLGGDLRFHLDRLGTMNENMVRFYIAEAAIALTYLHGRNVVHRDLKPDNMLLCEKGHCHLTDFNIAVPFKQGKPLTAVAGSMAYMAPEVLNKKGYYQSCDWWSLGVVAYELLFGKRPFRGRTNSELANAIMKDSLGFPSEGQEKVSDNAIDALKKFIDRDITTRMGCVDGLNDLKKHPWFEGLDWDAMEKKEAKTPFEPDSKRSNFDVTHELEELLLEDNPLKAKKRKEHKEGQGPQLSAEQRMMEEKFTNYDFTAVAADREKAECESFTDLGNIQDDGQSVLTARASKCSDSAPESEKNQTTAPVPAVQPTSLKPSAEP